MSLANESSLKEALAAIDASVEIGLAAVNEGKALACKAGCAECCKQPIPLTPLELFAIADYCQGNMKEDVISKIRINLKKNSAMPIARQPCPFLLDDKCSIYQVRPIACRRYLLLGKPCGKGEIPTETRPGDMMIPSAKALDAALLILFPWHSRNAGLFGAKIPEISNDASKLAFMRKITTIIQAANWLEILK